MITFHNGLTNLMYECVHMHVHVCMHVTLPLKGMQHSGYYLLINIKKVQSFIMLSTWQK